MTEGIVDTMETSGLERNERVQGDRAAAGAERGIEHYALPLALGGLAGLALRALLDSRRYTFTDRVVLITGGSRGLGLALARRFAAEGARLALLARNALELERAARDLRDMRAEVLPVLGDVRERESVERSVQEVLRRYGRIDVLVNNAGIIQVGPFEHMEVQDFAESMATHFWGPLYTIMATVPHMKRQDGGRIVNIASIGGKIGVPHLSPYSASKFALVGLSESLRAELAGEGIRVTTVCPWLARTGSYRNVELKGHQAGELTWFGLGDSLPLVTTSAEQAANRIVEACRRGQPQLITGNQGRLAARAHALFPTLSAMGMELMDRLLPPPNPDGSPEPRTGWELESPLAPSILTRLSDRAMRKFNQRPEYAREQA